MPPAPEAVVTQREFDELHHRLYGNGQPGDIETIKRKYEALEKKFYLLVVVVVVTGMLTGSGMGSVEHIWKLIFP